MAQRRQGLEDQDKATKPDPEPSADEQIKNTLDLVGITGAKKLRNATVERLAVEAENENRRLRGEPPLPVPNDGLSAAQRTKALTDMVGDVAIELLNKGVKPSVVDAYILGHLPGTQGGMTSSFLDSQPVRGQQGLTITDFKTMYDMVTEKKSNPELTALTAIMDRIDKRMTALETKGAGQPKDGVADFVTQLKAYREHVTLMQELVPTPAGGGDATSVEHLKETNRHGEEMERIKVDKDHKTGLRSLAEDAVERIGEGAAKHFLGAAGEDEGAPPESGSQPKQTFICKNPECGAENYIMPGIPQFACGKCGDIYKLTESDGKQG